MGRTYHGHREEGAFLVGWRWLGIVSVPEKIMLDTLFTCAPHLRSPPKALRQDAEFESRKQTPLRRCPKHGVTVITVGGAQSPRGTWETVWALHPREEELLPHPKSCLSLAKDRGVYPSSSFP